jgi:hypothetical protein
MDMRYLVSMYSVFFGSFAFTVRGVRDKASHL